MHKKNEVNASSRPAIEFRGDGKYWDQASQKFISQAEAYVRTSLKNVEECHPLPSATIVRGCISSNERN